MRDGVPWARPPDWVDPKRRLIRNTYTSDVKRIRLLGTQLRLPFDHPSPAPGMSEANPDPEIPPETETG